LRWSNFLRLHAQGIIACDFFIAVAASFRLLYVFVVIEHRSRWLIHCNVTAHPSAAWTLQQLRDAVGYEPQRSRLHGEMASSEGIQVNGGSDVKVEGNFVQQASLL
jgi:hypothetical protein